MLVFIGTYTRNTESEGVYAFDMSADCRRIAPLAVSRGIDNPSWLALHPSLPVLYSVNEFADGVAGGEVSAFGFDPAGELSLLSRQPSHGADPCHLAIDPVGKFLLVSNYTGGSFACWRLGDRGEIVELAAVVRHSGAGTDPVRQDAPHVHTVTLSGGNAHVVDLGTDTVVTYALDATGNVDPAPRQSLAVPAGAGPRLLALGEHYGYVINELDNTVLCLRREAGELVAGNAYSTLPPGFTSRSACAHIAISADGRFVYGSNRGHDSIVVFKVESGGRLALVQHIASGGRHPRHFCLSPDGAHLLVANRDSDNIVIMSRDEHSGQLERTGADIRVPAPVCIAFVR